MRLTAGQSSAVMARTRIESLIAVAMRAAFRVCLLKRSTGNEKSDGRIRSVCFGGDGRISYRRDFGRKMRRRSRGQIERGLCEVVRKARGSARAGQRRQGLQDQR